jgi:hypothetical protein
MPLVHALSRLDYWLVTTFGAYIAAFLHVLQKLQPPRLNEFMLLYFCAAGGRQARIRRIQVRDGSQLLL